MNEKTETQLNEYIEKLKSKLEKTQAKLDKATARLDRTKARIENSDKDWVQHRDWTRKGLPLPRLELYWERDDEEGHCNRCTYVLVYEHFLSLKKMAYEDDPTIVGVPLGQTKSHGSPRASFVEAHPVDPERICVPFRDWSHALSDANHLKLPLYVTTCDDDVSQVLNVDTPTKTTQKMLRKGGKAVRK